MVFDVFLSASSSRMCLGFDSRPSSWFSLPSFLSSDLSSCRVGQYIHPTRWLINEIRRACITEEPGRNQHGLQVKVYAPWGYQREEVQCGCDWPCHFQLGLLPVAYPTAPPVVVTVDLRSVQTWWAVVLSIAACRLVQCKSTRLHMANHTFVKAYAVNRFVAMVAQM